MLNELRRKIDRIDAQISALLKARLETVKEIKKAKKQAKLAKTDPAREAEILDKMETEYEKNVFKEIIAQSRKIQE